MKKTLQARTRFVDIHTDRQMDRTETWARIVDVNLNTAWHLTDSILINQCCIWQWDTSFTPKYLQQTSTIFIRQLIWALCTCLLMDYFFKDNFFSHSNFRPIYLLYHLWFHVPKYSKVFTFSHLIGCFLTEFKLFGQSHCSFKSTILASTLCHQIISDSWWMQRKAMGWLRVFPDGTLLELPWTQWTVRSSTCFWSINAMWRKQL